MECTKTNEVDHRLLRSGDFGIGAADRNHPASYVNTKHGMCSDELGRLATGRAEDLFAADISQRQRELSTGLRESRVLVIGGAGSIGSATVELLSSYQPSALHIVDQDENNLTEVVRDYRNCTNGSGIGEFLTVPMDFGSGVMRRWLEGSRPYDYVFNFAAVKHVRSEKNVYSLLHMLDTNVVKQARFIEWLAERNAACRYFCVSTDKAANPVSMMGATKRIMEAILFAERFAEKLQVTSARFANVAFSNGSLLASFLIRLQKLQPLAVPSHTRRYFVSLREAGQICLLAALCAPAGRLVIPRLQANIDLVELQTIAVKTLAHRGFQPRLFRDPEQAKLALADCLAAGNYPLLVTNPDTSGEKPYEEFLGWGEIAHDVGFTNLMAVQSTLIDDVPLFAFVEYVEAHLENPRLAITKQDLVERIRDLIPVFQHVETDKCLDDRV